MAHAKLRRAPITTIAMGGKLSRNWSSSVVCIAVERVDSPDEKTRRNIVLQEMQIGSRDEKFNSEPIFNDLVKSSTN